MYRKQIKTYRNITGTTPPPPHNILYMLKCKCSAESHKGRHKKTMKEDESALLVYLFISLCIK